MRKRVFLKRTDVVLLRITVLIECRLWLSFWVPYAVSRQYEDAVSVEG